MSIAGLFVVGTDTGVGKTFVAAAIVRALVAEGRRVGVLKPVATGATESGGEWISEDAEALLSALGRRVPRERVAPLVFEAPLAPSLAARWAGTRLTQQDVDTAVDGALAWWSDQAEVMIVEGVGGFLCPLAEGTTVADLAVRLDYPLVIVARRGLGTLNHTLLTVEAIRHRGLRIAGIVMNGAEPSVNALGEGANAEELARRLEGVAVLADLPHASDMLLVSRRLEPLDWHSRCGPPRLVQDLGARGALGREEPREHVQ